MKLFVSYPSDHREAVEPVVLSLRNGGHTVFFDRDDLPPGQGYDEQIEAAIRSSTGMVFFLTPRSFAKGSYQLTELEVARKHWPSAHRRVLPVDLAGADLKSVPPYLKSVTVLQPKGNLAAEVSHAVAGLRRSDWRRVAGPVGVVALAAAAAVAATYALLMPEDRPSPLPSALTANTVDWVVDQLVPEAEKIHIKDIVRAPNISPFLFLAYEAGQDIVFNAIKWSDGQWRIARTVRDTLLDFKLSDWKAKLDEDTRSIVVSGCRPHLCSDVWGFFYYQLDRDRAWVLKAAGDSTKPSITTPLGLPDKPSDLFNFEQRLYVEMAAYREASAALDAAIMHFPRKRAIPPVWDTYANKEQLGDSFRVTLSQSAGRQIERIYREDLDGDGQPEWLVQASGDTRPSTSLHMLKGSTAVKIFEDPGDVDASLIRFARYPVLQENPYLAIGGAAGTGLFPFWYVLQADGNGRFKVLPSNDKISDLLNEAFDPVYRPGR